MTEFEHHISVSVTTFKHLGAEARARALLGFIARQSAPFLPDRYAALAPPRHSFDSSDIAGALRTLLSGEQAARRLPDVGGRRGSLLLVRGRGKRTKSYWTINWHQGWDPSPNEVTLRVYERAIDRRDSVPEIVGIAKGLYDVTGAAYGWIAHGSERGPIRSPRNYIPTVWWGNLLGPPYVEMFGRQRLLNAPCHRVEELADGGVFLVLSSSPFDFEGEDPVYGRPHYDSREFRHFEGLPEEQRALKQLLLDYLGREYFYVPESDKACRTARCRGPRFDLSEIALDPKHVWQERTERQAAARGHRRATPEDRYNWGLLMAWLGRLDDAVASFRRSIELRPGYLEAHVNLGDVLHQTGDLEGAIAELRTATEIGPDDALAHYNLGIALSDRGDLEGAIEEYRITIALRPDWPEARNNLGIALQEFGDVEGAIGAFREAVRLKPDYAAAQYGLAVVLHDRGELCAASLAYREAIMLRPDHATYRNDLAIALQDGGDNEGAIAEYREALRIDPEYAEAHAGLAGALCEVGQYEEAWREVEKAEELGGTVPEEFRERLRLRVTR